MDEWACMRFHSIRNNLEDIVLSLKENLLKYGFIVKENLPRNYSECVVGVDYDFSKFNEPSIILHCDLTKQENIGSVVDFYDEVVEVVGEDKIGIYHHDDTDLFFHIRI